MNVNFGMSSRHWDFVVADEPCDTVSGDQTAAMTKGEFVGKYTTPSGLTVRQLMPVSFECLVTNVIFYEGDTKNRYRRQITRLNLSICL